MAEKNVRVRLRVLIRTEPVLTLHAEPVARLPSYPWDRKEGCPHNYRALYDL